MGSRAHKYKLRTIAGHSVIVKKGVLSARTLCDLPTASVGGEGMECLSCRYHRSHDVAEGFVPPERKR